MCLFNLDVWDEWTSWSICDGCNAQKTRTRSCNQPSSNFGGPSCSGDQLENLPCFDTACFSLYLTFYFTSLGPIHTKYFSTQ